jgi:DNA-binding CsgD family transcriptional regulator
MDLLRARDLRAALDCVGDVAQAGDHVERFAEIGVQSLRRLVASELTTLVRYHADERGPYAHRISDSVAPARFRETALFNEYYRCIGLDHAVALPIRVDDGQLVSFVLNRRGRDFSDREVALLDALRRPLAELFGRLRAPIPGHLERPQRAAADFGLTPREAEVLRWLGTGKTDREIAGLLGTSPRTVHKHLQRVYVKLGVETRTAAVMRALAQR